MTYIFFKNIFILLCICFINIFNVLTLQKECVNSNVNYADKLGTKTGYRFRANFNDSIINVTDCSPIKIYMVVRHGTRYPGTKVIRKMQTQLNQLKDEIINNAHEGGLCQENIDLFKTWKLNVHELDDKNLAREGEYEMIELAERMRKRFPQLFSDIYSNNTYHFRYTDTQRCSESARHFTIGLFGRQNSSYVWYPEPLYKDPILRFYLLCTKWRKTIKKNPFTYQEVFMFEQTYMQQIQSEISMHLGLKTNISVDLLKLIYKTCGFETAWNILSPWCSIFSSKSIQALEYLEDLKYYWVDGYGFELTWKQACPIIKDVDNFFQHSDHHTSVYFTHSGTILKLLAHLGLYNDTKSLRHNNYLNLSNRKWKVSKIDSFGTNLVFVLYKCGNENKIMLMHQERPVQIPGCPENEYLCSFNTFINIFNTSLNQCDFDIMCQLNDEENDINSSRSSFNDEL